MDHLDRVLVLFSYPDRRVQRAEMEDEGDAHTLDLLTDLRNLCDEINAAHGNFTARLNDLMRQMANPNVHGLDRELTYRVMQLEVTMSSHLAQWQRHRGAGGVSCGR